jgi:hypothetical protein
VQRRVSFTESQLREAVAAARSTTDVLRALGLRPAGGNHGTIRRYIALWSIPTDHFDPYWASRSEQRSRVPLGDVLVRDSGYSRADLKRRLYQEGLKTPACELCGQGEIWKGRRMSLILDHINGEATDNRLENLRIVCPNCNATLETHCGKNKPRGRPPIQCAYCGDRFRAARPEQRFCSNRCAGLAHGPSLRRVERPPFDQLLAEIDALGYSAVGRKYGVSDNAIRKWVRAYEAEAELGRLGRPELVAQRGDDGVRGVALGDDRADAVDALDHAGGLVGGEGADDSEDGAGGGRADALDLGPVEGRQPEIEDDRVRLLLGRHADRLLPIGGRADDLEARVGEHRAGEEAEAWSVVADEYAGRGRHQPRQDAT